MLFRLFLEAPRSFTGFTWFRMVSHSWVPLDIGALFGNCITTDELFSDELSSSSLALCFEFPFTGLFGGPQHTCKAGFTRFLGQFKSMFFRVSWQVIGRWEHHAITRCLLHFSRHTPHPENVTTGGHQATIPPPVPGCSHDLSGFQGKPKDPKYYMKPWQSIILSLL